MRIDGATGRVAEATFVASPNQGERPPGQAPELIVVHGISLPAGQFGGGHITELFTNRLNTRADARFDYLAGVRVSAHVLIARDGGLTQYVAFDRRAWHAGESVFEGRRDCNDFSIGIELEGTDTEPYRPIQYDRLEALIRGLRATYPAIGADRVVGHCHIAPGRKSDPGPGFDWQRLARNLEIRCPITQRRALTL
ncbi:1,6-anhydro-N-acetylmuramyl-L-alanine amidase AmpD [Spiribacter roseus]|uniref:1,6-anhydro-N-acetylmuramyl-L-alanine amidase AmpD n=1 Tax=Spiribacter roseus TaxID=1855875 RepID=UPI00132F9108|nr:1,6-anhydro-N-acetylmuramyl-L-alanine amidase AmpD [Spiribacter roseus]KAF0283172.1 N-acetyl-anhydromuranmyl-L-alanine amidase [Spiribacter roseus]